MQRWVRSCSEVVAGALVKTIVGNCRHGRDNRQLRPSCTQTSRAASQGIGHLKSLLELQILFSKHRLGSSLVIGYAILVCPIELRGCCNSQQLTAASYFQYHRH